MLDRRDPWKWPFSVGLAFALVIGLFLFFPAAWINSLFPSHSNRISGADTKPPHWITLIPPVDITFEPDTDLEPEQVMPLIPLIREDPRWWAEGVQIQAEIAVVRDFSPSPTDSITVLLEELGVGLDFLQLARPDSVLANRLALMRVEDSMRFDELKPYLEAMTRSRAYADILSRAADMYGDFLQSEIMVTD